MSQAFDKWDAQHTAINLIKEYNYFNIKIKMFCVVVKVQFSTIQTTTTMLSIHNCGIPIPTYPLKSNIRCLDTNSQPLYPLILNLGPFLWANFYNENIASLFISTLLILIFEQPIRMFEMRMSIHLLCYFYIGSGFEGLLHLHKAFYNTSLTVASLSTVEERGAGSSIHRAPDLHFFGRRLQRRRRRRWCRWPETLFCVLRGTRERPSAGQSTVASRGPSIKDCGPGGIGTVLQLT